jgi:hypothetical protein
MVEYFLDKKQLTATLFSAMLFRLTDLQTGLTVMGGDLRGIISDLKKSSGRLEKKTYALIFLTIVLAFLTVVLILF